MTVRAASNHHQREVMTLPSICSGVFHTWIWVKKNSMLKKPTCAGLQVPLYQQKYGV